MAFDHPVNFLQCSLRRSAEKFCRILYLIFALSATSMVVGCGGGSESNYYPTDSGSGSPARQDYPDEDAYPVEDEGGLASSIDGQESRTETITEAEEVAYPTETAPYEESAYDTASPAALLEWQLGNGNWTCTDVLAGAAPFMRGATFRFNNGVMTVSSGGTTVNNTYRIEGVLSEEGNGALYSALIRINRNSDVLQLISDDLLILSWGGERAKLQLQR